MRKKITCVIFISMIFVMSAIGGISKMIYTYNSMDGSDMIFGKKAYQSIYSGILEMKNLTLFKEDFIDINGLFQRVIGKKVIEDADPNNKVIKLDNGQLTFIASEPDDLSSRANTVKKINNFVKDKNKQFLYVQAPYKTSKYDNKLPFGIKSYVNDYADDFIKNLNGEVDYIDLREEMRKDALNPYDYFFNTDHHWTPEGAFYGFQKVADKLKNNYGIEYDERIVDLDNYNKTKYEDWFLGSQGKRVGRFYGGVDDIILYEPKFDTDYDVSFPEDNIYKSGQWGETVIDRRQLEKRDYYNSNAYVTYTGGDYGLNIIKNNTSYNDKKILLVRDSFGCAFSPFLSLACKQLDTIDFRHFKGGSIFDYIEDTNPDVVIILFNPYGIQYIE